jgi:hypothetical protein
MEPTELYWVIKNNLAPRLKGKLGKTLLNLSYTGNFLTLQYFNPTQNALPQPQTYEYLTLGLQLSNNDMNWHAGFLERVNNTDDKYFMLTNLLTTANSSIDVKVEPPVQGYNNYRFRNVEGQFDTTFSSQISKYLTFPKGEGYLFQVAPVAKYGGNLIADEIVGESMILYDDMVITNGATLTIVSDYYAYGNIIIENGSIDIYTDQFTSAPKINFYDGKKLIIKGPANISGTQEDKLTLDFITADNENGIVIEEGGTLTISNCIVKNAQAGILGELNVNYLNAENVDFIDCSDYSVLLHGQSMEQRQSSTPPPAN